MEKNVKKGIEISMLLDIYQNMLTEKQADVCNLYYNQNLSLGEIAEELQVTRQAIRKSLVEAEKNLKMFEEKLQIFSKQKSRQKKIEAIIKNIEDEKLIKQIEELAQ